MSAPRWAWLAAAALIACAAEEGVREPVWGKQPCDQCAMVLSDKRFGAELITKAGDRKYFDDVGCMVKFLDERHEDLRRAWVRDADTGRWLDPRSARYRGGAPSPMDYGFDAHVDGGVSWDEMRAVVLAKRRES